MGELPEKKESQEDGGRENVVGGAHLVGWVGPVLLGLD